MKTLPVRPARRPATRHRLSGRQRLQTPAAPAPLLLAKSQGGNHDAIVEPLGACTGRVEAETRLGGQPAIIPFIKGSAIRTGLNMIRIDPGGPFGKGFPIK
jgi:hypothetical protein